MDLEKVRQAAERVARSEGLEIADVEWKVGKQRFLRVYIDRLPERTAAPNATDAQDSDGSNASDAEEAPPSNPYPKITHGDCERVSQQLSVILDVEDLIPGPGYVLEVSSPGMDRALKKAADFERFRGHRLKLTTREPVNSNRHFEGKLESFENGKLLLDLSAARKKKMRPKDGEALNVEIELRNVEKANLVPEI